MKKDKPFIPIYLCLQECIVLDTQLSCTDRIVIMLITALDNNKGCFATNSQIGYYLKLSEATISKSVHRLEKLGYITRNETTSGRSATRNVRKDLKSYKRGTVISSTSHEEMTTLACEKDILIDKEYKEDIELNKEEKTFFQKTIKHPFREYWSIYNNCKSEYENQYDIIWNPKDIVQFVLLFNNVLTLYFKSVKNLNRTQKSEFIVKAFGIIITHKPKYFYNSNPYIFNRKFNDVVQQKVVKERMAKLKMRFLDAENVY